MADMDPEHAFLESQREYDPAGDYSAAAPQSAPVNEDDEEAEYDPAGLLPSASTNDEPTPSDRSASMPRSTSNSPPIATESDIKQPPAAASASAQSKQPRTVGGFVVESEDEDDEVPDSKPQTMGTALLSTNGLSPSAQASLTNTANNTVSPNNQPLHSVQDLGHAGVSPSPSVPVNVAPPTTRSPAIASQGTPVPDVTKSAGATQLSTVSATPSTFDTAVAASLPKPRLPQDRVGLLEDRISDDPRGDAEAWLSLIEELRRRHKFDEVRAVYDRFFKVFPTAAEQWIEYINMEIGLDELQKTEKLFERSVASNPHVGLWSAYINYIRRIHNMERDPETARPVINQVYDFVLNGIGIDISSGRIWLEYIEFLKSSLPGVLGGSDWRDMQKMDTLRRVYQRAIAVPTNSTLTIWKEYDKFEHQLNKAAGRKHLQEQSPFYMTARSANNVLENLTKGINRTTLPKLPPVKGFDGYDEYINQVNLWKAWIQWEKEDPLLVKEEKPELYNQRVIYLYKQALMPLRFWPELWYEAAEWCLQNGLEKEGNEFLQNGIDANPESCLLAFRRAHQLELADYEHGDNAAIRKGDAVRAPFDRLLDELYELTNKMKKREEQAIARTKEAFSAQQAAEEAARAAANRGGDDDEDRDEELENAKRLKEKEDALQLQIKAISTGFNAQMTTLKKLISYTWIALMRSMRRIQGKGSPGGNPPGFRGVFTAARKRGKLLSATYVASALIEHHCYKDAAATKIFERGLKLFPDDEEFALEYIKHLMKLDDLTNARAVFETVVNRLTQSPESVSRAKPLFAFFHDYESHYGELEQIVKLEKRMGELFPEDPQLTRFAQRFASPSFDPTAVRPVISLKAQMKPPALMNVIPTVEEPPVPQAPVLETRPSPVVQSPRVQPALVPVTHSPKRPFEDVDNELAQPRKLIRGESPLKGAAGRRLDAARRNMARASEGVASTPTAAAPQPLPREVTFLLSIIPHARHYNLDVFFNPHKLVDLLKGITFPGAVPSHAPTPAPVAPPPAQFNQPMMPWGQPAPSNMAGGGGYYGR